jgi:hypothetical protein
MRKEDDATGGGGFIGKLLVDVKGDESSMSVEVKKTL